MVQAQFPEKLEFLFKPCRYKVAYGGRGSGKSWSFAKALLIQGAQKPLRILCVREVQKSIKDSVHRLLSDKIEELELGSFYTILETEIRGANGTAILFSGLSNITTDSLKSFEGVDRCWAEEAHAITKDSWNKLTPTIRKDDSEIWLSFNPELETDETYRRFITSPPPDCISVSMNYSDNPWFPDVLEKERLHAKATMPEDDYQQIWEGKCRPTVIGAIYAREVATAMKEGRIGHCPYDPQLKVHTVWDMGWNDSMVVLMVQRLRSEIRIIDHIEESQKTLAWYMDELNKRRYNWGLDFLPHDASHKDYKTGQSAKYILANSYGRRPKDTPNISVEEGIKTLRGIFGQIIFNAPKTERLVECLKRYRRGVPITTGEPGAPLHDEWSHGADCARYLALVAGMMSNEDESWYAAPKEDQLFQPINSSMGY